MLLVFSVKKDNCALSKYHCALCSLTLRCVSALCYSARQSKVSLQGGGTVRGCWCLQKRKRGAKIMLLCTVEISIWSALCTLHCYSAVGQCCSAWWKKGGRLLVSVAEEREAKKVYKCAVFKYQLCVHFALLCQCCTARLRRSESLLMLAAE